MKSHQLFFDWKRASNGQTNAPSHGGTCLRCRPLKNNLAEVAVSSQSGKSVKPIQLLLLLNIYICGYVWYIHNKCCICLVCLYIYIYNMDYSDISTINPR